MRTLFLVFLLVGSAHGLLGSLGNLINNVGNSIQTVTNQIGQTATNLWNGATNHVNNVVGNIVDTANNAVGQVSNTVNGIQVDSGFLWDNVFGPAYDMLVEGGQSFLDDKFGNVASSIGRRSAIPENILSGKYAEITAHMKNSVREVYNGLFKLQQEAIEGLQKGETNVEEKIQAFYSQLAEMEKRVTKLADEAKSELKQYASTLQGEWVNALNQYTQVIDRSATTIIKMFEQLANSIVGNFVETVLRIVPSAQAIIQSIKEKGLLSFLH